jgi:hypothetical protein
MPAGTPPDTVLQAVSGSIRARRICSAGASETKPLTTEAGDSVFMRKKLEAVKRELRSTGEVADRAAYHSLLNVRARVNERYGEAIDWLRSQGREEEARRFELMQRTLPPVRSEKQLLADALMARPRNNASQENERGRTR